MVNSRRREAIVRGDVEQHGQITHGEWYLRSHREDSLGPHPNEEQNLDVREVISSLTSGAVAGAVAKTTIAPLDRTKIIFQTSNQRFTLGGVIDVLKQTYKSNGVFGLFRGNSATMARVVPYASIQFTAHEKFKQLLRINEEISPLPPMRRFVAGSFAGITAAFTTYPLDMVRARLAITQKNRYRNLGNIFVKIYSEEGLLAFYRGFVPTVVGIIPYAGTSFFVYETFKKIYHDAHPDKAPSPIHRLAYGACAGLLGQSLTYPLEIIRRRMQTDGIHGTPNPEYRHMLSTLTYVYRTEGLRTGLYKGLSLNWVKGPVAVGISFTVFDIMHSFLQSHLVVSPK